MHRTLIVSTCGTSLLTHQATSHLRDFLARTANSRLQDLAENDRVELQSRLDQQTQALSEADIPAARRLSAELNGLLAFYEHQPARGKHDVHLLMHTDTFQGEAVANVLCDWLRQQGLQATPQQIAGLNTADIDSFRAGLNELVSWAEQTLPGYRRSGFRVVFNLVAGFKTLQGFMQTLGMFYAEELLYIFEGSDQLLRIPRLPIQIEDAAVNAMRDHLRLFRLLDPKLSTLPAADCAAIPETFLYRFDNEVELSPWGRLVWSRHKSQFYTQHVLDPLSPILSFSPQAVKAAGELSPDRKIHFNERMDDLARYLDSGRTLALSRLDFKQLKGNPCPPATHECDLWADRAAWRAFGHFDGKTFVVDSIGPGLH
jgi:putative CRISPR-associated protein (TIGR02619 family)